MIIQQAGRFGGWAFYTLAGKLYFTYNFVGLKHYTAESTIELPQVDKVNVKVSFDYDGGMGKGGKLTLFVDGKNVGTARVDRTNFSIFSGDETVNVGFDSETMVVPQAYTRETSEFNQKINFVTTSIRPEKKQ